MFTDNEWIQEYSCILIVVLFGCIQVFMHIYGWMDNGWMHEYSWMYLCICVSLNVSMNAFMDGWKCKMMIQASINVWKNVSWM